MYNPFSQLEADYKNGITLQLRYSLSILFRSNQYHYFLTMSEQALPVSSQARSTPSVPDDTVPNTEFGYTNDEDFFAPARVTAKCKARLLQNTKITYRKVNGEMTGIKAVSQPAESLDQSSMPLYRSELVVTYNALSHSIRGSVAHHTWLGTPQTKPISPRTDSMCTVANIDEGGNLVSALLLVNLNEIPVPADLEMPEGHTHVSTCDIVATEDLTQFPPTMTRVWTANTPDNPLGNNQAARQW